MKISVLGPAGTFSHEVGLAYCKDAQFLFENTIYDVFDALSSGRADGAVVPLENSVSGSVGETLDALLEFDLKVKRVVFLDVVHNLVGNAKKDNIRRLYVHPLAHAQCREYLRGNFSGAEIVHTSSNAASATLMKESFEGAIVPGVAAKVYGKKVIDEGVQDNGQNVTLFGVLGKEYGKKTGNDRTFIVFDCVDRAGILYEILGLFAKAGINLSKIESRPNKRKMGEYIFYVEFCGHPQDEVVSGVISLLKKKVVFLKVLGAYPAGGSG